MTAIGKYLTRLGDQHGGDDDNPSGRAVSPLGNQITIWGTLKSLIEQSFDSVSNQVN